MLTEPPDLGRAELATALADGWSIHAARLDYVPVGFGSHHWRADDGRRTWFASVDDLEAGFQPGPDADATFEALERAFGTAASLRDAGLEFVLAPLRGPDGRVIRRVSERYALRVAPFVEGESKTWGPYETADERREVAQLLGRLHATTVPNGLTRRDDLAIPSRSVLGEAVRELDRPWESGPFAEPARLLLREHAHALERRLDEYDDLASRVRESSAAWVVTHGEPHRANFVRAPSGTLHLLDWDTTLLAPRERDLRFVLDEDLTGLSEYVATTGPATLDREALDLFARWWNLADVCLFTAVFRRPHTRTADTIACWENFGPTLHAAASASAVPGAA